MRRRAIRRIATFCWSSHLWWASPCPVTRPHTRRKGWMAIGRTKGLGQSAPTRLFGRPTLSFSRHFGRMTESSSISANEKTGDETDVRASMWELGLCDDEGLRLHLSAQTGPNDENDEPSFSSQTNQRASPRPIPTSEPVCSVLGGAIVAGARPVRVHARRVRRDEPNTSHIVVSI